VTGEQEYSHYLVFGSPDYELEKGKIINVDIPFGNCFVINDSDRDIVIEYVIYGGFSFGDDTDWIYPQTGELVDEGKVDYFFDEEPPDEVSVSDGTDQVIKVWLRYPWL
jgi:hypothetical protein